MILAELSGDRVETFGGHGVGPIVSFGLKPGAETGSGKPVLDAEPEAGLMTMRR